MAANELKGTFVIIGPRRKLIKLLSNERIDALFLCRCFRDVADIKPENILGLRTKSGVVIRLENPKLSEAIDGKLCTLELYPSPPLIEKQKTSRASSGATNYSKQEKTKSGQDGGNNEVIRNENSKSYGLKSPKSAWMLFNAFKLANWRKECRSEPFGELIKRSGAIWQEMNDDEKSDWRKKAEQEKKEYRRVKREFDKHKDYSKVPVYWLNQLKKGEFVV